MNTYALCYRNLLLLFAISISTTSYAQTGWQWAAGSIGNDTWGFGQPNIVANKFGNSFLVGNNYGVTAKFGDISVSNPDASQQLILTKVDNNGVYKWVLSSSNTYVNPMSIAADDSDNVYLLLQYTGAGMIGPFYATAPVTGMLMKIAPNGGNVWLKRLPPGSTGRAVGIDATGNVYMAGMFYYDSVVFGSEVLYKTIPYVGSEVMLIKYSPSGAVIWARNFGDAMIGSTGGIIASMTVAENGNVVIVGSASGDSTIHYEGITVHNVPSFLIKYDSSGNVVWVKGMPNYKKFYPRGITMDRNENIYLTLGEKHGVLYKYDASGALLFTKLSGGSNESCGDDIVTDSCNNVWICGPIFKGSTISFDGHENEVPVNATSPLFIVGYDEWGNYLTSTVIGSGGSNHGFTGIDVDDNGNFYVGGQYNSEVDLGMDTLTSDVGGTMFVAKYKYGSNCGITSIEKVDSKSKESVRLYPNPIKEELVIDYQDKISRFSVYNVLGQEVFSNVYNAKSIKVDLSHIPSGIYWVRINGAVSRKFIKN